MDGNDMGNAPRMTTTSSGTRHTGRSGRSSAEDVLADRIVWGETDADEYRQRRDALRS